jgi:selT/selW/selH-like putative selenoprotein
LKSKGVSVGLIKGSNGIFDVEIDGKLVYSKSKTGRFPNRGELSSFIK